CRVEPRGEARQFDENFAIRHFDREGANLALIWRLRTSAVEHDDHIVQGARDTVSVDDTFGEWTPFVGTAVLERVDFLVMGLEQGDGGFVGQYDAGALRRELVQLRDANANGHEYRWVDYSATMGR